MTAGDPFDADNPDNLPAYFEHQQALAEAELWNPARLTAEWRAIRVDESGYPREVGYDPSSGRLQLPVGFDEWNRVRTHPCWAEYAEQMRAVPAGEALGFTTWLTGGTRARPTQPFLCDPSTSLPPGWVRGDPSSTLVERPYRQVAHDPARHVVVRAVGVPSAATRRQLADAGFNPLTTGAPDGMEVTYFVRDRAPSRRLLRPPVAATRGRSL